VDNSEKNITIQENSKNCGIDKMEENNEQEKKILTLDDLNIKKICKSHRCSICNSDYVFEIHELKKSGLQQNKIIEIMKQKYNVTFSPSAMSRHFSNLYDRQMEMSAQIINADLISEATAKSYHTQKVIALLQCAFTQLEQRAKNNSLIFDISDLEKLMKMKYQTLTGNDELDKDILAIFQKATNKYGISFQQATLFNKPQDIDNRAEE